MLADRKYEWKIGGVLKTVSETDVQKVIEHARNILDADPKEELTMEIGHLIFKKREGAVDVFIHLGEIAE